MNDFCPRCFIGHFHLRTLPYLVMHEGQLVSVPNAPVYHCDVCGYQEYDTVIIKWVNQFVNQTTSDVASPLPETKPADSRESSHPKLS